MNLDMHCADDGRRETLRRHERLNGIDYVEVSDDRRELQVIFLHKIPEAEYLRPENIRIDLSGGRRGRHVKATDVDLCISGDTGRDDCMRVTLDCPVDDGPYTLCVVEAEDGRPSEQIHPDFDDFYACVDVRFVPDGPTELDCASEPQCDVEPPPMPVINYLAKDFASFRQVLLDRLALIAPDWQERHIPDLGITLVELLAYAADRLSYFQDTAAIEAYIETARQRVSVRRHARLVDYRLHEGTNARAWVAVNTTSDTPLLPVDKLFFITANEHVPPSKGLLTEDDLRHTPTGAYEAFEPLVVADCKEVQFRKAFNELRIYTWGSDECCLPKGATHATLVDREGALSDLRAGAVLIFEEVVGPETGNTADADPAHRHAVRLTSDARSVSDNLPEEPIRLVEIEWGPEDALPFDLCLSARGPAPECEVIHDISIARANVILVDHGRTLPPELIGQVGEGPHTPKCPCCACPPESEAAGKPFHPTLSGRCLVFAEPAPAGPATWALAQDPHEALPAITLTAMRFSPTAAEQESMSETAREATRAAVLEEVAGQAAYLVDLARRAARSATEPQLTEADWKQWRSNVLIGELPSELRELLMDEQHAPETNDLTELEREVKRLLHCWLPRFDLLASRPGDEHFVVECEDGGRARLRFGNSQHGRRPAAHTAFLARYRVGGGPAGNVGACAINHLVTHNLTLSGIEISVCNPLPAHGGAAPETVEHARQHAPHVFRTDLQRAITAADYATLAKRDFVVELQAVGASLDWTGSWYEAAVAVDEFGVPVAEPRLSSRVQEQLERYRRMGHDLAVSPAVRVPLTIKLDVCVKPEALRAHVLATLDDAFSNRVLSGGRRGLFHPDNLTLGDGVFLSKIVATAMAIDGVESVSVAKLERYSRGPAGELDIGVLQLGQLEVASVDNDPRDPARGVITFELEGGR